MRHNSRTTSEAILRTRCIALTGGIATGKSTVAQMLRDMGFVVIDADSLARAVVAPGTPVQAAIVQSFGPAILDAGGSIDRKRLRDLVFADPRARTRLESITHPAIRQALHDEIDRRGLAVGELVFFYEAALIFETGSEKDFREVWATSCPAQTQIERLEQARGIPRALGDQILAGQMAASAKANLADRVIDTSGDLASVRRQVEKLVATISHARGN